MYYLLEKQTAVQSAAIQTAVPNQFEHEKSLCRTKITRLKRGLERKNCAVKKLQQICNEKCTMCE